MDTKLPSSDANLLQDDQNENGHSVNKVKVHLSSKFKPNKSMWVSMVGVYPKIKIIKVKDF